MKMKLLTGVLVSVAATGAVAVVCAQDSQQPYNNPVPVQTSINEIMVMAVDYAAHWIWDAQQEPPATEEDWFRVRVHATQLVALGSAIALGGTGVADNGWVRSPEWVRDSQALVAAGLDALEAAESRDFDELNAAGDRLVESCTSCHDTFKPELPTEGVLHRDVHRESRQAP